MVQLAAEHVQSSSEKVSASKLSVITGMHRRDALRIYKEGPQVKTELSVASKVIGQWQTSANYIDKNREPKILTCEGEESEFFQLVRSVSGHLNPYTVLYELERTSSVEKSSLGLKLKQADFVPKSDVLESARMMAMDVEDLMSAVEENITRVNEIPNLHLVTEYDNVTPEAEVKIRKWMLSTGAAFHKQARDFLSEFDRDSNPNLRNQKKSIRVIIGGFSRVNAISRQI